VPAGDDQPTPATAALARLFELLAADASEDQLDEPARALEAAGASNADLAAVSEATAVARTIRRTLVQRRRRRRPRSRRPSRSRRT
jgi:hypothetical protein